MPPDKLEFPCLLKPGFHRMSMDALREMCVAAFPLSSTRSDIMTGLTVVVGRLKAAGMVGELWIDGSFLTQKIDPADVDVVLRVTSTFVDSGAEIQHETLEWLNGNLKDEYKCDSYLYIEPPEDREHQSHEWRRAYWIRQFGFSRGNEMKGLAVIVLPGDDT